MVEDAVEAIGFGKFQWKLSVLTGLAWASISGDDDVIFGLRGTRAAQLGSQALQGRTRFPALSVFA